jgi:hypothetical protein
VTDDERVGAARMAGAENAWTESSKARAAIIASVGCGCASDVGCGQAEIKLILDVSLGNAPPPARLGRFVCPPAACLLLTPHSSLSHQSLSLSLWRI